MDNFTCIITKSDGTPMDTKPRGVKMRLADVFKAPGQGFLDFKKQLDELTPDDLQDFAIWFDRAGYPIATADSKSAA